jgi:hypothetical protein
VSTPIPSTQPAPPTTTSPGPTPRKPRWPWYAGGTVLGLVIIGSCSANASGPASGLTPAQQTDLKAVGDKFAANLPAPTPAPLPTPTDFAIQVKTLSKSCFGSAGCNVTYQIDPQYVGSADLSGRSFTVVYEVIGGDSGPQIDNFRVSGDGTAHYSREELVSTSSSGTVLTAKATGILNN